jgi:hypothetical protein
MNARRIAAGLLLATATLVTVTGLILRTGRGLIEGIYTEGTDQFLGVSCGAAGWRAALGGRHPASYQGKHSARTAAQPCAVPKLVHSL